MRHIRPSGLAISFSHAGTETEALTTISLNIPLESRKYLDGINLIESIKEGLLPNLNQLAISQELTPDDLDLLAGFTMTGTYQADSPIVLLSEQSTVLAFVTAYLTQVDDAAKGVVNFIPGQTTANYTP